MKRRRPGMPPIPADVANAFDAFPKMVCRRLLQGSPAVLPLLEQNPFPVAPPRFVRAVVWRYQFTNFAARAKSGDWWRREPLGLYLPPVSLAELSAD